MHLSILEAVFDFSVEQKKAFAKLLRGQNRFLQGKI